MQAADKDYWAGSHPRPLTPGDEDVLTYEDLLGSAKTRLLLGNTRLLMPICTAALDLEPFLSDPKVRQGDWATNEENFDAIFGDGVMNFTKELADSLLKMASAHCKTFVVRAFNFHMPIMRVAAYFPSENDFAVKPTKVIKYTEYSFFKWEF